MSTYSKRHVHADLIIEWANNPSIKIEYQGWYLEEWFLCPAGHEWDENIKYRRQPVEQEIKQQVYGAADGKLFLRTDSDWDAPTRSFK